MMVTKPSSFRGAKDKCPTWKRPIARVVAALMRRSTTFEDSSCSCVTQSSEKTELLTESPTTAGKVCVEVVEVESVPSSPKKSKDVEKNKSRKSKKSSKKEGDGEASKKVRTKLNPTATNVTTDLDLEQEETEEGKKTSSTTKTKKKKSTKGDKKTKKSKKCKKEELDHSNEEVTPTIKKKKKKKKSSSKKKKKEKKRACSDLETTQQHDEDTSVFSSGSAGLEGTSELNRHDLTPNPMGISTRTEDSSIRSTSSFLRASNRSLQSASARPKSMSRLGDNTVSPARYDTKPASFGTLDEFFQSHQLLLDPLDTVDSRKQRSCEEACGSLDLDEIFQVSSGNDTTTKSTTSSTEKTQGSSSHHRRSRLASPGRKGGRRATLITDWTAPVDASLHWSSCHENSSFDFLTAPENSIHGSASITPTTVSKTSTKLNGMDSSHRITKLSDHDLSTCDGEEFAEDMFDSDSDDQSLSDDELKESASISFRKSACRTISETSFDSTCIEEVHAAFEGGDAFSDGEDKTPRSPDSSEVFEILQMTPRTQKKTFSKCTKAAALAEANLIVSSDH